MCAVHYVDTLLDGSKLHSTRDNDKPYNFKLGYGEFLSFRNDFSFGFRLFLPFFVCFVL